MCVTFFPFLNSIEPDGPEPYLLWPPGEAPAVWLAICPPLQRGQPPLVMSLAFQVAVSASGSFVQNSLSIAGFKSPRWSPALGQAPVFVPPAAVTNYYELGG